ncbi:MAG: topology modulation protein [Clostridiales bacterium]|nr:topology modulation protein [Clostridiales bacterium]
MAKIIVIGCPGSGKSTMTFQMEKILKYPVLHLDKIYHIDNDNHITREELVQQFTQFAKKNDNWIIDGNYISTIEQRINLADTIVLLDIDTDVCIQNAINRSKKDRTADLAEGFDNTKLEDDFIQFITNFKDNTLPKILQILEKYKDNKNIIILRNYTEVDYFLKNIKSIIK